MKLTKQTLSIILTSCLLTLSSCDSQNNVKDGGISSGGGGTLPAESISIYEASQIAKDSKLALRLFINTKRSLAKNPDPTSTDKFYYGQNNLAIVLNQTPLEIRENAPCYDSQRNEVDGSIYSKNSGGICISAFLISKKLSKERAQTEIYALILHELSHLLGATESEAIELQKDAALFLSMANFEYIESDLHKLSMALPGELYGYETAIDAGDYSALLKDVETFKRENYDFETASKSFLEKGQIPLRLVDFEKFDYYLFASRLLLIAEFSIIAEMPNHPDYAAAKNELLHLFGDSTVVMYKDAYVLPYESNNRLAQYPIQKVQTPDDLKSLLKTVNLYFGQFDQYYRDTLLKNGIEKDLVYPSSL